jgi:hypothetical protein
MLTRERLWSLLLYSRAAIGSPRPAQCHGDRASHMTDQISSAHFISTVTFSVQLHKLHSKVRTSGLSGSDTTPVSIIGPWHFGHGGRSISMRRRSARGSGMFCSPKIRRERDALCHR